MGNSIMMREKLTAVGSGFFLLSDVVDALKTLLPQYAARFSMIYIDPPNISGARCNMFYSVDKRKHSTTAYRNLKCVAEYTDLLSSILEPCRMLLSDSGSIFLHSTDALTHHAHMALDNVFGADNYINELIWTYRAGGRSTKRFSNRHDTILFYSKNTDSCCLNISAVGIPRGDQRRNHMKRSIDAEGRVFFTVQSKGKQYTYYEDTPIIPGDVWDNIDAINSKHIENTGYPGQKPTALMKRLLLAATSPDDLVLDLFAGSGSLAICAAELDRKWVAVDNSPASLMTLRNRLLMQDMPLFKEQGETLLSYPVIDNPKELPNIEVLNEAGRTVVTIKETSAKIPIRYAAICDLQDDLLTPVSYTVKTASSVKLSCTACLSQPAIQVVYADNTQAIIPISSL